MEYDEWYRVSGNLTENGIGDTHEGGVEGRSDRPYGVVTHYSG